MIMPVEIKSRVSLHSQENARYKLRKILGAEAYFSHQKYFFRLSADDPKLLELLDDEKDKKRVTREMCQMLHHVHTYGVDRCLLLVGNHTAVMYAVEIKFPPSILIPYNNVIEVLYDKYVDFLYNKDFTESSFPCK